MISFDGGLVDARSEGCEKGKNLSSRGNEVWGSLSFAVDAARGKP